MMFCLTNISKIVFLMLPLIYMILANTIPVFLPIVRTTANVYVSCICKHWHCGCLTEEMGRVVVRAAG